MRNKVADKQYISEMCFVCGKENPAGLKTVFYNLENGKTVSLFQPEDHFQSYPQRLHGGIAAAVLDETLGRAILAHEPDCWAVTAELTLRYKKPVPLGVPLKVVAEVTENSRRLFKSAGDLLLPDGQVAISAVGTYMKQSISKITGLDEEGLERVVLPQKNDKDFIEF
jgi:acyl-coenzyme A thioesterase PaaI-like protein